MGQKIDNFSEVTTENPVGQLWKLLHSFLDTGYVTKRIHELHKIPLGKYQADIRKQANQIRACVQQAEEFFMASANVGLATRPLLLYYGAVALSQALVLLRRDGNFALDKLRKQKQHKHHGLELNHSTAEKLNKANDVGAFLSLLQCRVFTTNNKVGTKIPRGHFPLVYASCVQEVFHLTVNTFDSSSQTHLETQRTQGCANILPIDTIAQININAFTLLKSLPDFYFYLLELGIWPDLCRGNINVNIVRGYEKDAQGNKALKNIREEFNFFVDGINSEQKKDFLSFYAHRNPDITVSDDRGANLVLRLIREYPPENPPPLTWYFPDIVEDLNGKKYYILKPDNYIQEIPAYLALLFILGYLARYYPDRWVSLIDTKVQIAEVLDSILNVAYRKFPNLILDQLTLKKHYVHL